MGGSIYPLNLGASETGPFGAYGKRGDFYKPSSNQYFAALPPTSQPQTKPGIVPPAAPVPIRPVGGIQPSSTPIGGGFRAAGPLDPAITQMLASFLGGQVGKGATPFNLSALLPTGGTTEPGQLAAPENPILKMLQQFLTTGQGGPTGTDTLASMAATGMPIDQTPAWQAMVESMKRQIGEQEANLREQFAFGGNLASSPFGRAMADFESQTAKDLNAQLLSAQTGALESARGRQLGAAGELTGLSSQLGQVFQGMDQQAINDLLAEFIRTRPEYGPLLNMMFGLATTFPPIMGEKYGIGTTGAILGGAGELAGGIASLYDVIRGRE